MGLQLHVLDTDKAFPAAASCMSASEARKESISTTSSFGYDKG